MQTDSAVNARTGQTFAPGNNFTVLRVQREVGRSNFGAMFVGRQGVGSHAPAGDYNRAYGLDVAWQATTNGRYTAFLARTDSLASRGGTDYAGGTSYTYANDLWTGGARIHAGRRAVQSRGRILAAAGLSQRRGEHESPLPAEALVSWIRRIAAARELHRLPGSAEPLGELTRTLAFLRHPDAVGRTLRLRHHHRPGPSSRAVHDLSGRQGTARGNARG